MPEITAIKVNLKRPDRRSVYIDGQFTFSVSEGIFSQRDLREGSELSEKEIAELRDEDDFEKAKLAAVNLLSYRPRSVKEITDRLRQKGWSDSVAEKVAELLVDKGYLNDNEFARIFSRDKVKNKCLGPMALKNELFKTGVPSKVIEKTIRDIYEQFTPEELIHRLLIKRGIRNDKAVSAQEKQRIINQLCRKGFTWEQMEPFIRGLKLD
ncbi:MAG: hypothetical protein CMG71_06475 [Candidatus Marinimicrobia bacterium]|nr:hypothetical protein [Candidatus Neomarinimicrobiota bacterium]